MAGRPDRPVPAPVRRADVADATRAIVTDGAIADPVALRACETDALLDLDGLCGPIDCGPSGRTRVRRAFDPVIATADIGCAVPIARHGDRPAADVVERLDGATGGPVPPRLRHRAGSPPNG